MKLTIQDKGALLMLGILLLIFPVTNGYIAMAIDMALTQIALVGSGFIQVPATLLAVYVFWRATKNNTVKTAKPKKSNKHGMKYEATK
jgi:hypothetical protein